VSIDASRRYSISRWMLYRESTGRGSSAANQLVDSRNRASRHPTRVMRTGEGLFALSSQPKIDRFSLLGDNKSMEPQERTILTFTVSNGKAPFEEWLLSLRDKPTQARILRRIDRLRLGNFGDAPTVGEGVFELRIHFGPGYRVYFGLHGAQVILLLCGGDKSSQPRDIATAQRYWKEFLTDGN
jgi:putative addiction module killer protein